MRGSRRLQCAAACVLISGYAALSHYSNSAAARDGSMLANDLGAALALTPVLSLGFAALWRYASPLHAALMAAVAAALLVGCWPLLERHFFWLYLLQDIGLFGLLALGFGRSLGGGRVALCTEFAGRLHGPLTPQEVAYTRRVTVAWTVFFLAMILLHASLFAFATLRHWSAFANFCTLPLVGAMFVAEYRVRRRALPPRERGGILATLRVYFASP